jgi:hypothetical protein
MHGEHLVDSKRELVERPLVAAEHMRAVRDTLDHVFKHL